MTWSPKSTSGNRALQSRGFSLIEVVVTTFVILILSAIAIPNIATILASLRLRSSANEVQGLISSVRLRAVKENRFEVGACQPANACNLLWVDVNRNSTPDASEYQLSLPVNTILVNDGGGNPAFPATTLGFTPNTAVAPAFNASGLPCVLNNADPSVATVCSSVPPVGFVYFVKTTQGAAVNWAAVSVSPAGRVRSWYWSGTAWK